MSKFFQDINSDNIASVLLNPETGARYLIMGYTDKLVIGFRLIGTPAMTGVTAVGWKLRAVSHPDYHEPIDVGAEFKRIAPDFQSVAASPQWAKFRGVVFLKAWANESSKLADLLYEFDPFGKIRDQVLQLIPSMTSLAPATRFTTAMNSMALKLIEEHCQTGLKQFPHDCSVSFGLVETKYTKGEPTTVEDHTEEILAKIEAEQSDKEDPCPQVSHKLH